MEAPRDSTQADESLLLLAQTRFPTLSNAETKLLSAVPKGEGVVCGPSFDDRDPNNDPSKADQTWGQERVIRTEIIRWLFVDRSARDRVDPWGIRIYGAKIAGKLDLSYVTVPFPLFLRRCRLTGDADLSYAKLPLLNLDGSWVHAIDADGVEVRGGIFLGAGFRAEGEVRLRGAQIGRNLNCGGGTFKNSSGTALYADSIEVQGGVFLRNGFHAEGEVSLLDAQIGGTLECDGGTFRSSSGSALIAERIKVEGGVFLRHGFHAEGVVRLMDTEIRGTLECDGATFRNPSESVAGSITKNFSGIAMIADRVKVQGDVFLRAGFQAEGEVRLVGAQIGGELVCQRGTFRNPSKIALVADGIKAQGAVFLSDGFHSEGEVRLSGAQIGGMLGCERGTFINPSDTAFAADMINVQGGVFLRNGFLADGEVRLLDAQIGGTLECDGTFRNRSGIALGADRIKVKGTVSLRGDFQGEVRILSAQIGADLDCAGSTFTEVNAETATIRGNFFWRDIKHPEMTMLDLRSASAGTIADDNDKSWPKRGNLFLDGFVYGRISAGATDAGTRLRWLTLQSEFSRQPYRQLAKVLRETGDDDGARLVLYEMERGRREREDRTLAACVWGLVLRTTVGYGIYPLWAIWWLLGLATLGAVLFHCGYQAGAMTPADEKAYCYFLQHRGAPPYQQQFTSIVYSLENSVPLFRFGQDSTWTPDPAARPGARWWLTWPSLLRLFRRVQIVCGWILTTLFAAGVSGIVQKD
jgi:hypothetical protein